MPLDMARRAAIPLPAPRSAAAGGRRSETRQEFSPRSQSGTSRRSPLAERGRRPVAVELAIGEPPSWGRVGGRARGREPRGWLPRPGWKPPPGGRAVDPGSCRGQDSGAGPGRSFRHREGMGSRRTPKPVSGLPEAWRAYRRKSEIPKADNRSRRALDKRRSAVTLSTTSCRVNSMRVLTAPSIHFTRKS